MGLGLDQVLTSLALLPSQVVGSAHFLLLGSGGLCATCVGLPPAPHSSTAAPASTGECVGDSLQRRYVSRRHMRVSVPRYHVRDICGCVSARCVLVTADDLGVVCWWMFDGDGDGDGNRAQCLRPVMMSQPCSLPDTRVPHHLTALLRSGDPQ